MENRAAVFTNEPQDVELYQGGAWRPGSLLGWRHGRDGSCEMWVRPAGGGGTAWLGLDAVRLPEPEPQRHLTLAASTETPDVPAPSELTATLNLFAVRDLLAEEDDATRAPTPRGGGRRRAPEPGGSGASARNRGDQAGAAEPVVAAGRHRAPGSSGGSANPGRHRAADTGLLPVVREDGWPSSANRPALAPAEPDVDLYTRPMRLADRVPHSRRPRWDGPQGGVPPLR